jgi:alcohol dehydrogenase
MPMVPFVAIPTTAGTGSECQSFAVISQAKTHVKMACGDAKAAAAIAVLDPELTLSQPDAVTASSGIDALSHAVESAVTTKRNPLSQLFSYASFRLCVQGLTRVFGQPDDLQGRGQMLLGAAWAGYAIENSMLGAAHAAANPLTAHFGVIHGRAVGLMLPAVVRYNCQDPEASAIYQELALTAGLVTDRRNPAAAADALAEHLESYLEQGQLPRSLAALGIRDADLVRLAEEAAGQWTAQFNPRRVAVDDFRRLYEAVLGD